MRERYHCLHSAEEETEAQTRSSGPQPGAPSSVRTGAGPRCAACTAEKCITCFRSLLFSLSLSLTFSLSFLSSNKLELAVAGTLLSENDFFAVNKETWGNEIKLAALRTDTRSHLPPRHSDPRGGSACQGLAGEPAAEVAAASPGGTRGAGSPSRSSCCQGAGRGLGHTCPQKEGRLDRAACWCTAEGGPQEHKATQSCREGGCTEVGGRGVWVGRRFWKPSSRGC